MEFGPIWRAMMRNKSGYVLIALQIAVTMAIMVNAIAIIQERSQLMARPSGIDEDNIFHLTSMVFAPDLDQKALIDEDLDVLRSTPGVIDAINTQSVPLSGSGWSMSLQHEAGDDLDGPGTAIYFTDDHAIDTYGLNLIAGRNFDAQEIVWNDPAVNSWPPLGIISRALASVLFPDDEPADAVGRTVYIDQNEPVQIVGVVDRLQAPWNSWSSVEQSMLVPMKREGTITLYVVRAEPGMKDQLMPQIEEALAVSSRGRIIDSVRTMGDTRKRSYLQDASMIKMLTFITVLLTAITGLGIVGLASFSVSRRTRQIGTRRALGATRSAILRYFMVENFLVSAVGVGAGAILAVGLNIAMVSMFDMAPMAWYIVPVAMVALWLVGQIAVAGPARRATMVPPAVATRAV